MFKRMIFAIGSFFGRVFSSVPENAVEMAYQFGVLALIQDGKVTVSEVLTKIATIRALLSGRPGAFVFGLLVADLKRAIGYGDMSPMSQLLVESLLADIQSELSIDLESVITDEARAEILTRLEWVESAAQHVGRTR